MGSGRIVKVSDVCMHECMTIEYILHEISHMPVGRYMSGGGGTVSENSTRPPLILHAYRHKFSIP